jgi:flavin reductase (DIM6/NTAB) family NADH-FMN oxidoreductase RutF
MTWPGPSTLPPFPGSVTRFGAPPAAPLPAQTLRDTLARLPAAVTVVTTDGVHGPAGLTAGAVCPLSLDPPLLLVCLANRSRTLTRILDHGTFTVNVLRQDQAAVAEAFADPDAGRQQRFAAAPHHRAADGALVLDHAVAWLACRVRDSYPGGDHTILTGRIHALDHTGSQPLIHFSRGFRSLA